MGMGGVRLGRGVWRRGCEDVWLWEEWCGYRGISGEEGGCVSAWCLMEKM
jgi:hypothetical protein